MKDYKSELSKIANQITALRNNLMIDSKIPECQKELFGSAEDIKSRLFFIEMEARTLREMVERASRVDDAKKFVGWVRSTQGLVPNVLKLNNGITVYATPGDRDFITVDFWQGDIHHGGITVSPGDDEKIRKFYEEIAAKTN